MKPPLPTYIGEDMFKPKMNYWLIAAIILIPVGCFGFYYYNKNKTQTSGKDTVQ